MIIDHSKKKSGILIKNKQKIDLDYLWMLLEEDINSETEKKPLPIVSAVSSTGEGGMKVCSFQCLSLSL